MQGEGSEPTKYHGCIVNRCGTGLGFGGGTEGVAQSSRSQTTPAPRSATRTARTSAAASAMMLKLEIDFNKFFIGGDFAEATGSTAAVQSASTTGTISDETTHFLSASKLLLLHIFLKLCRVNILLLLVSSNLALVQS